MSVLKMDVAKSVPNTQLCGQKSAIHAMWSMYENNETDAVLFVDTNNAFNNLNRAAFLRNIGVVCPQIATFVRNCYTRPARLFVIGGVELTSLEGTTKGDPLRMAVYAIGTPPLLDRQRRWKRRKRSSFCWWFDSCWHYLRFPKILGQAVVIRPTFRLLPQGNKDVVKNESFDEAVKIFDGTNVQITRQGAKHLGAVVGCVDFKAEFISEKVESRVNELSLLSDISIIQPQSAYTCFVSVYQHKITYFLRTIHGSNNSFNQWMMLYVTSSFYYFLVVASSAIQNVNSFLFHHDLEVWRCSYKQLLKNSTTH